MRVISIRYGATYTNKVGERPPAAAPPAAVRHQPLTSLSPAAPTAPAPSPAAYHLCFGTLHPTLLVPGSHLPLFPSPADTPLPLQHVAPPVTPAERSTGCRSGRIVRQKAVTTESCSDRARPGVKDDRRRDMAKRSEWSYFTIDFAKHPGTQFQNRFLQDFRCPIVRPLANNTAPTVLWIAQTNRSPPASVSFVVRALDHHFCAPPESFPVRADLPFIYQTYVAHDIVKIHLLKISVFAMDGTIFRFHQTRPSAVRDVIMTAGGNRSGAGFKFPNFPSLLAHQWPNAANAHLPDKKLDGDEPEQVGSPLSSLDDSREVSQAPIGTSVPMISVIHGQRSYLEVARQPFKPTL